MLGSFGNQWYIEIRGPYLGLYRDYFKKCRASSTQGLHDYSKICRKPVLYRVSCLSEALESTS